MSVLSSPSPTLSPKSAFSHDRSSFASLRRSSSHRSYRLSPSSSRVFHSHVSSPASSIHTVASTSTSSTTASTSSSTNTIQRTPTSAPKRRAVDDGLGSWRAASVDASTQYSPPEYPPTSRRSMTSTAAAQPSAPNPTSTTTPTVTEDDAGLKDAAVAERADSHSPPPPEPALRQDPEPHTPKGSSSNSTSNSVASDTSSDIVSPTKRAKGESSTKTMPTDYMKCDVRDLGIVIADMLMELIRINDPLPVRNEQLTRYHSRAPPGISVHDYLHRLIVHATLSPPILLSLVYYIDKLSALYPVFNISSLTVHRYLITAATVAAKGLSDSFWTNNTYSRVGGISVRELALLELDFLERMDWKIIPPADILVDYYRNLVERSDNYELDESVDTATQANG